MNIDITLSRNINSLVKGYIKYPKTEQEFYVMLQTILYNTQYDADDFSINKKGTFATCIYCKNSNFIIKTNILSDKTDVENDGTRFWLEYALSVPNNKNLPNIVYHYLYNNYYFVIMEKLDNVDSYIPYIESESIIEILNKPTTYNIDLKDNKEYQELLTRKYISKYATILLSTIPTFINILTPVVNNHKYITLDICSENIMVRAYKRKVEFILLDPFWRTA